MKIKLLILIGMTVVPLLSSAQTGNTVFFNKGEMSVVGTDTFNTTTLYVAGDFVVSRDATTKSIRSQIALDNAKIVITGNFYQDGFYDDNPIVAERIPENGFVIRTTAEPSRIEFRGTAPQVIGTRLFTSAKKFDPKWKAANYVNFPTIAVNNNKHVTIEPELATKVQGLDLYRGRLILDSRRFGSSDIDSDSEKPTNINEHTASLQAHLYLNKDAVKGTGTGWMRDYGKPSVTSTTTLDDFGAVEVRVALDSTDIHPDGWREADGRSIVGMGSPFDKMKADYFMYNFLMFPWGNNILGYWNFAQTDPTMTLSAGSGFVVGIDLRGSEYAAYEGLEETDPEYAGKIDFPSRVKGTYKFSRFAFNNKNNIYPLTENNLKPTGNQFSPVAVTHEAYDGEYLVAGNRSVGLISGFNYLANPYTTPLNMEEILTGTSTNWGVTIGQTNEKIYPYVWVLNPSSVASGLYNFSTGQPYYPNGTYGPAGSERLSATYTYFLMKAAGATYVDAEEEEDTPAGVTVGGETVIAPLQMFVVYSPTGGGQITIPENQRTFGSSSVNFLRSATAGKSSAKRDDFLFEVVDLTTKAYDRAAVVLRTPDEVMSAPSAYVDKVISSVVSGDNNSLKTVTTAGAVSSTINSVLYTTGPTGAALESKFLALPASAVEVTTPLCLSPSSTAQKIVIRAKRLNTMDQINEIWLNDKLKNTWVELSTGNDYETSVTPTDAHDRFVLKFTRSTTGIGDEPQDDVDKSITSYYADGVLTVGGFEQSDINSLISIYDIQGRMLKQVKVTDLTMRISEVFYPGAYIVKVNGNNSYVSKFLVR